MLKVKPMHLSEALREKLERFPEGSIIFREGDPGYDMFIIFSGTVRIYRTVGGAEEELAKLKKGDFFGEMAVLEDYPQRSATAQALSEVEVLRLGRADLEAFLTNPKAALGLLERLSARLRETTERLAKVTRKPISSFLPPLPSSQGIEGWAVLVHEGSGRFFPLRPVGETTIGRHDPVTGITPDVDLTSIDPGFSVSRRHAVMRAENEGLFLVEVNEKSNGTFLNTLRLEAHKPYQVMDADWVQLGNVLLQVRILVNARPSGA
ncbi:MAG: cyclic nucleotide-binding domain-containing protein [Thermoanaerobaculum sp.]|nr:cyclic nucleotide-binding domain-containing protein [Thermoanaerobaculum sp.]MDW7967246.1 cyclic nucleotide-binding domain-containing protein [Thermoanaerobaculum sp.]